MNRELINPDDPQMTAYALGELNLAEAAAFESRLQSSPMAQAELVSMREIMDLLSDGLRGEWQTEKKGPELKLLAPVPPGVIVTGNFRPVRRHLAVAAAVAGMMLVSGMLITGQKKTGEGAPLVLAAGLAMAGETSTVHVPQLFLAEEIDDLTHLDLVEENAALARIDASYLDMGQIIPASFATGAGPLRTAADRSGDEERIDSYLPPLSDFHFGHSLKTGMIEKRLSSGDLSPSDGRRGDSVLVSGYITMGASAEQQQSKVLAGFRPVSISGNPVVNVEADLQLLSDLNGLQNDLSEVIGNLPEGAAEKADLEGILEKNRRLISQLKLELTR